MIFPTKSPDSSICRRSLSVLFLVTAFFVAEGFCDEPIPPLGISDTHCCDAVGRVSADDSRTNEGMIPPGAEKKEAAHSGLSILILGDSMSLTGFGERLDSRLRKMPGVAAVNTYMACGTNPLSWLKRKPFTSMKTRCGYWSIEDGSEGRDPKVIKDVYGMRKGHRPSARRVPKLEDLVAKHRPDILVFQNGNNLFGCFKDKRTIREKTHTKSINWYLDPFIKEVSKPGTSLKKLYWISPPQAGCVTKEIQEFLYSRISERAKPVAHMIDSRKLTSYPYRMMGPDKEHFWGPEVEKWSDSVFDLITADLQSQPLHQMTTLDLKAKTVPAETSPSESAHAGALRVLARLSKITPTPTPDTFAPYHELLVGYRYEVEKVLEGKLDEQAVLVMHPAFIKLQAQDLGSYEIGKTYEFGLRMMDESSLWGGMRTRDDTDSFELMPYLLTGDENRHPDAEGNPKDEKTPAKPVNDSGTRLASQENQSPKPDKSTPLAAVTPLDPEPEKAAPKVMETAKITPAKKEPSNVDTKLKVLFLGESMSLMGFGPRLDSHLRDLPEITSLNTYMTCGTNPRSWLKGGPYARVKTRCGYWSIESIPGNSRPRVDQDIYGMRKGHRPSARSVPKLEDLVAKHQPDILIYQGGNALFGCFKDKRTINEETHSKTIRWYIDPFITEISRPGTSLKKFYWITPPQAGSVTNGIQEFLFDQFSSLAGPVASMIDSRKLTSYPYRKMSSDKEQFWGDESDNWTDDVFEIIKADLRAESLEILPTLDVKAKAPVASDPKLREGETVAPIKE